MPAPIKVPYFDLSQQTAALRPQIDAAIKRVIDSGVFVSGPEVEALEHEFAAYTGCKHAVAVNSGTAALHLALAAARVGPGDEVITTASSFIATSEAIRHCGALPKFVDIDPETCQIDPSLVEKAANRNTTKILPVHLYGQFAPLDKLISRWGASNIIEDACQAVGATYRGQHAGKKTFAAAYSFYPGKNLGALGEGGMLVTDLANVAEEARSRRSHGIGVSMNRYYSDKLGYNYRLDEMQAAILRVKLPYLESWNSRRRSIARRYRANFSQLPGLELQHQVPHGDGNYHLFVLQTMNVAGFREAMEQAGVGTARHYPRALHHMEANDDLYSEGHPPSLPHAERLADRCVSLPIWPEMTEEQVDHVIQSVFSYFGKEIEKAA